jgi:hypothetical protein
MLECHGVHGNMHPTLKVKEIIFQQNGILSWVLRSKIKNPWKVKKSQYDI